MKGTKRIVIGVILILVQLMSVIGNVQQGVGAQISFASSGLFLYDLIFTVSYYFIGIVGAVLLISGLIANRKEEVEDEYEEQP